MLEVVGAKLRLERSAILGKISKLLQHVQRYTMR
jgi:hypothetical protein